MGRKIWEPGLGPRFASINGRIFYTHSSLADWMRAYADTDGFNRTRPSSELATV